MTDTPPVTNFSLQDLDTAQREHDIWAKVIYAFGSGDEATFSRFTIQFSQFFLSQDNILCRYWPEKTELVEQYVIPETYVPVVLKLIHDMPTTGHLGRDKTLAAARRFNFWPLMLLDIGRYVAQCISCGKHKGTTKGPATMLQYPPPEHPWDVVSIDLVQLPESYLDLQHFLVCVGDFFNMCGCSTRQKQNSRICGTRARDSVHLSIQSAKNTTE